MTDERALGRRVGFRNVDQARAYVGACGGEWLAGRGSELLSATQARLNREPEVRGVVLVGGYDVTPSRILNTLPPSLRDLKFKDSDRMQVWSDDEYGDLDRNGVPELPVSRVPDAGNAVLLLRALSARAAALPSTRAGIRNLRRLFAENVYNGLPGAGQMSVCEPPRPEANLRQDVLYFMLHGTWKDGRSFRGESPDDVDPYPVAVETFHIPDPCPPVVFAGCCYGALTVDRRARETTPQDPVTSLPADQSIALTCLLRGANAFVGCTGVHYSPMRDDYQYLGEPLHRYFFEEILKGQPPAAALFRAKVRYALGIPFRGTRASKAEEAAEHKILRQFTCLGIGW